MRTRLATAIGLSLFTLAWLGGKSPNDGPPKGGEFPAASLTPKEETGATRFLASKPDADGRGVIVAIFDTGVDPGAIGLQTTSDGKPKIVDIVDGTGSGDIDTSTVRELKDGKLEGLTGRTLSVGASWNNPSGKYHLGVKRAYELFPGGLQGRVTAKRREKWDEQQREAATALKRQLFEWRNAHREPTREQIKERDDFQARLDELTALQDSFEDPGPVFDCVVFNDGAVWRAAIDTNENGDLGDEKVLTNYRLERQFGTFSDIDMLNYAVNIYDEGNLLSIVTDSGAHGTHVAGIVAANHPDHPELNGLAPGAQLVSVKIGDTRMGSSSMGTGEVRGMIAVLQNKCDLINMSFGGPTSDPEGGRLPALYSEIVNKHGVIFVSSAGNNGPALSTAGSPGATTSAIFGVGAYLSPAMMAAQYSRRDLADEMPYTFTSNGPTFDGDFGPKFSAPGGAIAPVPNWTLQKDMLMNGTSMAAPNACGSIALILSAMKQDGLSYTPHRIRRALENTARLPDKSDVFGLGRGVIQIDAAYEYLKANASHADLDLRFEVRLPGLRNARGVYLREADESNRVLETDVQVKPIFHDDAPNRDKINFEMRIALRTDARWIQVPEHLALMHNGRSFNVRIDPTKLPAGVHYSEVQGLDADNPERGPIFRVPVTVVRPERLDAANGYVWKADGKFEPGKIERRFVVVPEGATWADAHIRAIDADGPRAVVLHVAQRLDGDSFADHSQKYQITMEKNEEEVRSFAVVGGRTLELCLTQNWASQGHSGFAFEVVFHGVKPSTERVYMDGGEPVTRLDLTAPFAIEQVAPSASLDKLRQTMRPSEYTLRPLPDARDLLPENRRIYELILTYKFSRGDEAEVTPRVSISTNSEYTESFESMFWMVFDEAKRLVATGSDSVKLPKGDYTLRFHVRHDDPKQLEKLKDAPLMLDIALGKAVNVATLSDPDQVFTGGKFGTRTLEPGERVALYLASPAPDALPKEAKPGDTLLGTVNYAKLDDRLPGEGAKPGGYPLVLHVPPAATAEKKDEPKDDDPRSELEKLAEAVRDLRVSKLANLRGEKDREAFEKLADEILKDYPNHLPVLVEKLKRLDDDKREERVPEIVAACDAILGQIDTAKLAAFAGVKQTVEDAATKRYVDEMDKLKSTLVDTLYRKGRAYAHQDPPKDEAARKAWDDAFEQNFVELRKWVNTTDKDYVLLHIARERFHGRLGNAIKLLDAHIKENKPDKKLSEKRAEIFDELGWKHWADHERKWTLIRYPATYPPF